MPPIKDIKEHVTDAVIKKVSELNQFDEFEEHSIEVNMIAPRELMIRVSPLRPSLQGTSSRYFRVKISEVM